MLSFEEFQSLILEHPILGDDEWEFSYVQDGIQCPHYRAIQPKRHILCLHLRLEVIYPCAKDEWRVHYYHQGHGKSLDEALKSFFSMDREPRIC